MLTVHKPVSRFVAFLLLAAAVGLPIAAALSSRISNVSPLSTHSTIVAEGTMPPPPPTPKQN